MSQYQGQIPYMMPEDDAETDLRDLLAAVLLRWKAVLACILIFGLLGCGTAFLRAAAASSAEAPPSSAGLSRRPSPRRPTARGGRL